MSYLSKITVTFLICMGLLLPSFSAFSAATDSTSANLRTPLTLRRFEITYNVKLDGIPNTYQMGTRILTLCASGNTTPLKFTELPINPPSASTMIPLPPGIIVSRTYPLTIKAILYFGVVFDFKTNFTLYLNERRPSGATRNIYPPFIFTVNPASSSSGQTYMREMTTTSTDTLSDSTLVFAVCHDNANASAYSFGGQVTISGYQAN